MRHEEEKQWLIDTDERLQYRKEGMYWDEPKPQDHCSFYGTREYSPTILRGTYSHMDTGEYSAKMWGVPSGFTWEKACKYTPIVIHNRTIETPTKCENQVRAFLFEVWGYSTMVPSIAFEGMVWHVRSLDG